MAFGVAGAAAPPRRTADRRDSFLRWLRISVPVGLLLVALCLSLATRSLLAYSLSPYPLSPTPPYREAAERSERPAPPLPPVEFELRSGETMGGVLQGLGLDPGEAHAAAAAFSRRADPRRLRPGDRYRAFFVEDGLAALEMRLDGGRGHVHLARRGEDWQASFRASERRVVHRRLSGELADSLEGAIRAAGGSPSLAYRMADVLQWDLDFNRDLRRGDRFEVFYEQVFLDGEDHGPGEILALTYRAHRNGGRLLEGYRYGEGGYYDAEGRPLRKMFLRSPLRYSRITSRFSHRRFHPVLKVHRPHYGIDYGAPVGTPVLVTAAGTVAHAGWDGGGGKTVKVRHPNGYLTAYLHLSRYASGIRRGARVAQGDVIGYVGSTGLATGAHLDYRVQVKGRWIDPLTLANTPAPPIAAAELASFRSWRDAMRSRLTPQSPAPTVVARATGTAREPDRASEPASARR
jgi:murein DD-endopeptidase MepM/ murein hydrolase activator NlpD